MKKIVMFASIVVFFTTANGQYSSEALKYSQNFPAVTARSLGMGGAYTSLGGDFSSVLFNPAGLGLYRKSEFVFTPSLNYSNMKADYLGKSNDDFRYHFNIGSIGFVGTRNTDKDKGLVSSSFAFGYIRQNTFDNYTYIRGTNENNSLSDYFMDNANGQDPESLDAFYERLAFDSYIIDTVPGSDFEYQTPVFLPTDQRKTIDTRGGIGNWSFAVGLNFSNVFYVGMGMSIPQLNYDRTTVHSEFDDNPNDDFSQFQFTEDLHVNGTGFAMNFGAMLRVLEIMRIGASLQLPTYYHLHEHYYNTLYSEFKNGDNYTAVPTDVDGEKLGEGAYEYKLYTPLKAQGGVSLQLGKMGIISADLEFVNYSRIHLSEADGYSDFSTTNEDIKDVYRSVVNLKLGGEVRFNNFSVRVGGGYYPSACTSSIKPPDIYSLIGTVPDSYTELSTGVGYRNNSFFIDLGFSGLMHKEKYNLYFDNTASLKQIQYRFLTTIGFRF
jgi:hypothetical protein